MTNLKDLLSDEEREAVEQAEQESRRGKTKYGNQITRDEEDEE